MRQKIRAAGWGLIALAVAVVAIVATVAFRVHGETGFNHWADWATVVAGLFAALGILLVLWDRLRPLPGRLTRPPSRHLVDDDVRFTVYRPRVLSPGRWASLLVFAHKTTLVEEPGRAPVDPQEQVEARARAHFDGAPPHPVVEDARQSLIRGAQLRIVPDLPGIQCNPKDAEVEWWEPIHEVLFRLFAGPELAGTVVRGAVRVWCGPLIIGEMFIAIQVAPDGPVAEGPLYAESVRPYRKIFPSYSHRDRAIVANFAEQARALGDRYLQDVLTLRSGERWNARLLELIEAADVFQLFWSHNSMRSPHCRDEWEHALELQRPLFVRPVYWEEPLPEDPGQGLPPAALRALHFVKVPVAPALLPDSIPARSSAAAQEQAQPAPRGEAATGPGAGDTEAHSRRAHIGRAGWLAAAAATVAAAALGTILHGAGSGQVTSPPPSTSTTLWAYATGGAVDSSPAVAGGTVYVGSNDHKVYALDAGP